MTDNGLEAGDSQFSVVIINEIMTHSMRHKNKEMAVTK